VSTKGKSITLSLEGIDQRDLFGPGSVYAKDLELRFPVKLVSRGNELHIFGKVEDAEQVESIIKQMIDHLAGGGILTEQALEYAIGIVINDNKPDNKPDRFDPSFEERIVLNNQHNSVRPRSEGQKRYIDAITHNDLVFSIGPAGTGKTYLAVACAVRALKERRVSRITLVRPAVEADESLGFLPGNLKEKIDPYLRPLYDALYDMLPSSRFDKFLSDGTIEVAPLAYMRGRTLNKSFIILDEAQNTTVRQMKMFLTRLGANSKAVVNGDVTQIDLPPDCPSGLVNAKIVLNGIDGIEFTYLSDSDVVRHRLVQDIIRAYDKAENQTRNKENPED